MAECFHRSLNRENPGPRKFFTETKGGNEEKTPIIQLDGRKKAQKSQKFLQEQTEEMKICLKLRNTRHTQNCFSNLLATGSRFIGVVNHK